MQKFSDPLDFPIKKLNSRATAKVSVFVLHIVNKQSNHPKPKPWHIYFYNRKNIYKGVIIYRETSMKNSTLFP